MLEIHINAKAMTSYESSTDWERINIQLLFTVMPAMRSLLDIVVSGDGAGSAELKLSLFAAGALFGKVALHALEHALVCGNSLLGFVSSLVGSAFREAHRCGWAVCWKRLQRFSAVEGLSVTWPY
jgi:hypothetical protein